MLNIALFDVRNIFNSMTSVRCSLYGIFRATDTLLIALRLASFLHRFMAWCIFNKKQDHIYINSTRTLQIISVYLILNFFFAQAYRFYPSLGKSAFLRNW